MVHFPLRFGAGEMESLYWGRRNLSGTRALILDFCRLFTVCLLSDSYLQPGTRVYFKLLPFSIGQLQLSRVCLSLSRISHSAVIFSQVTFFFLLKTFLNSAPYSLVMHFWECLLTLAQCLINYWTLKNLWEARALCDWAADMKNAILQSPSQTEIEAWSDSIRTGWMMVKPWNIYTRSAGEGGEERACGFYRFFGWTWCQTTHTLWS